MWHHYYIGRMVIRDDHDPWTVNTLRSSEILLPADEVAWLASVVVGPHGDFFGSPRAPLIGAQSVSQPPAQADRSAITAPSWRTTAAMRRVLQTQAESALQVPALLHAHYWSTRARQASSLPGCTRAGQAVQAGGRLYRAAALHPP